MNGFSPLRFSAYARDLEQAILNMGSQSELRKALGRDDIEVRFGGGKQFITMDDKTIEIGANASPADVARALNVAKVDEAVQALPAPKPVSAAPAPAPVPRKNLTGASFLANLIRQQQAAIKAQIAQAGTEMQTAMSELQEVANEATNQVKAVKAETADLKAALGLNSNGEPS